MAKKRKATETDEGGGVATAEVQTSAKVVPIELLPLTAVRPSPTQPRKYFDPVKMDELKADLARRGQQDPVKVKPLNDEGFYDLVDGERRWRCLTDLAEAASIDAALFIEAKIVNPADEVETLLNQLAANMHREGLTPVEEARAFNTLREAGIDAEDIANRLGIASRTVHARLALLELCEDVLQCLEVGSITVSHADELVKLPEVRQCEALDFIVGSGTSVRGLRVWIHEQGWTKKAEQEQAQPEGGGVVSEYDIHAAESEQTDGGADVIGEAAEDLKRQEEAPARAEAARKERQADETPDHDQHQGQKETESTRLYELTTRKLARKLARAFKPNEVKKQLFEYLVNEFNQLPKALHDAACECGLPAIPNPHIYKTLGDLLASLRAIAMGRLLLQENHAKIRSAGSHANIDITECELEANAEILGVTVEKLKELNARGPGVKVSVRDAGGTYTARLDGKSASSTAGEATAVAALARKLGMTQKQIENGGIEEDRTGGWLMYPPIARADKGKGRKSPKVAKKLTGMAIRAAVKAAGKAKTPKAKGGKRKAK